MDPGDSKNVYGNPRLFHPNYILNTLAQPCTFNVKLGWDNLGFPYTFLESPGSIEYCYVFGFLGPRQSLPWLRLKDAVCRLAVNNEPFRSKSSVNKNTCLSLCRALSGSGERRCNSSMQTVPPGNWPEYQNRGWQSCHSPSHPQCHILGRC